MVKEKNGHAQLHASSSIRAEGMGAADDLSPYGTWLWSYAHGGGFPGLLNVFTMGCVFGRTWLAANDRKPNYSKVTL
jgi:hypothetical protein